MQLISNLEEWRSLRRSFSSETRLGFVPTMGNLHKGHASLFLTSSQENKHTLASVFINPTQFNKLDDFTHYPRTLDADIELMAESGVDFCLFPTEQDIYADGYTYRIEETQLSQTMEGVHRPQHFNGMLTVVMKLLQLTRPHTAYFGEKDYQQYELISGMANAFFMDVTIKSCPTIRESSGLPYSSRNNRLTSEQKELAHQFARIFHQKDKSCDLIKNELIALGIEVDYLEEHQQRRFVAVRLGCIRLIDNCLFPEN